MTSNNLKIAEYLDELFPNPQCELIYHKDYELLIAIVLSAQSTDKRVNSVTPILFHKYKNLTELSNADISDLEKILRPIGSYHKKAVYVREIARTVLNDYQGEVPINRKKLEALPGVGRKTVNVLFSEYYHLPAFAVDTHVNRVSKRLYLAKDDDSVLQVEQKLKRKFPRDTWSKRHLQMVLFGRYYCTAKNPKCDICKLKSICRVHSKKKPNHIEV
mgnify:FL=1